MLLPFLHTLVLLCCARFTTVMIINNYQYCLCDSKWLISQDANWLGRMLGLKGNVCIVFLYMSGSLSATVIFMTWQAPLSEFLKVRVQLPITLQWYKCSSTSREEKKLKMLSFSTVGLWLRKIKKHAQDGKDYRAVMVAGSKCLGRLCYPDHQQAPACGWSWHKQQRHHLHCLLTIQWSPGIPQQHLPQNIPVLSVGRWCWPCGLCP